ncbi:hypothetical protein HYV58_00830 [Candidatus Peregrinibacteria bacterium]|nr:hypothetical protein [Candidatus Peregrinibacteria bacterium]
MKKLPELSVDVRITKKEGGQFEIALTNYPHPLSSGSVKAHLQPLEGNANYGMVTVWTEDRFTGRIEAYRTLISLQGWDAEEEGVEESLHLRLRPY